MRRLTFAQTRPALSAALVPALAFTLSACQRDARVVPGSEADAAATSSPNASASSSKLRTLPAHTDPCSWISAAEAADILGPLRGAPWRADNAESPEPDEDGHACVYPLAAHGRMASDQTQYYAAVELLTSSVTAAESAIGMMTTKLAKDASATVTEAASVTVTKAASAAAEKDTGQAVAKNISVMVTKDIGAEVAKETMEAMGNNGTVAPGWDNTSWLGAGFVGRLGSIAIDVETNLGLFGPSVPQDSIERLAALVRDRVPDIPIASPRESRFDRAEGVDPCRLLTREEAEAVLGALTVPPYRSDDHHMVNRAGHACTYYTGKHRAFSITPEWKTGKTLFRMAAGVGRAFSSVAGAKGMSADTLDGPWDEASAGSGGTVLFLTGDRMLEVDYGVSGVDLAAALRLARLAVKRLAEIECRRCD